MSEKKIEVYTLGTGLNEWNVIDYGYKLLITTSSGKKRAIPLFLEPGTYYRSDVPYYLFITDDQVHNLKKYGQVHNLKDLEYNDQISHIQNDGLEFKIIDIENKECFKFKNILRRGKAVGCCGCGFRPPKFETILIGDDNDNLSLSLFTDGENKKNVILKFFECHVGKENFGMLHQIGGGEGRGGIDLLHFGIKKIRKFQSILSTVFMNFMTIIFRVVNPFI